VVDGAVHAPAAPQRGIRRVGDGIDVLFGDVASDQLQAPAADLDRIGQGREYRAASARRR
jgi:hypothetical protein